MEYGKFQSTLPVWGATFIRQICAVAGIISIHAPRVGSDKFLSSIAPVFFNFNPRSPCGERP